LANSGKFGKTLRNERKEMRRIYYKVQKVKQYEFHVIRFWNLKIEWCVHPSKRKYKLYRIEYNTWDKK